jgi:hypothetical protein
MKTENDEQEDAIKVSDVAQKIERLKTNKIYYEQLQEKLYNACFVLSYKVNIAKKFIKQKGSHCACLML